MNSPEEIRRYREDKRAGVLEARYKEDERAGLLEALGWIAQTIVIPLLLLLILWRVW